MRWSEHSDKLRPSLLPTPPEEYEARWGEPGFDEQKLLDMIGGCARRRMLRDRTDLTPEQEKGLREVIDNEPADLWS